MTRKLALGFGAIVALAAALLPAVASAASIGWG